MNSEHVCAALNAIICNIECNRETQNDVDNIYDKLLDVIVTEMNHCLIVPFSSHTRKRFRVKKPYWNAELMEAWKVMHNSEKAFVTCKGSRREKMILKRQFTLDTCTFDKLLKRHKRLYDRGCLINIETINTSNPTEFWNQISRLGPRTKNSIPIETLLDNGQITRDKSQVLNKWVSEYQNLYLNENECYDNDFLLQCEHELSMRENNINDPLHVHNAFLNKPIEIGEIMRVLTNAKNNKSPGIDQIPYEVWKRPKLLPVIKEFFQFCLDTGKIPSSWSHAIISPIPKSNKHDKRLPLSYRGISLLNCMYKLYSAFLNLRLQKHLESGRLLSD